MQNETNRIVDQRAEKAGQIENSRAADNGGKLVFEEPVLFAQLLNGYVDMDIIKEINIRPEDIEDVTERFIPMFTEQRDADVVKKVHAFSNDEEIEFFIALIEHKSGVDYNVIMQMLRYMVYIWEDYEHQEEKLKKGISKTKGFKYPPILPIVYYEGIEDWTASVHLSDRIALKDVFSEFIPDFRYYLVSLNKYRVKELIEKKDGISFVMLINRLKSAEDFKKLNLPEGYFDDIQKASPDEVLAVIARVIAVVLRKQNVPEDDINKVVDQIKRRQHMGLFDGWQGFDVQEERRVGSEKKLIEQICHNHSKGTNIDVIVDVLGEDEDYVKEIYEIVSCHAPDYDVDKIYEELRKKNAVVKT